MPVTVAPRLAGRRVQVTATTVGSVGRILARSSAAATVLFVGAPVGITIARGGHDLRMATVATALLGAAVAGFCVEPARTVRLLATPVSAPRRRGLRLLLLAGAVGAMWAGLALAARARSVPVDLRWARDQVPAGIATALTALAVALAAGRRDDAEPGLTGAVAALAVVLTSSALAMRWPRLPTLAGEPVRWWWLAVPAGVATVAQWRDPAARRRWGRGQGR